MNVARSLRGGPSLPLSGGGDRVLAFVPFLCVRGWGGQLPHPSSDFCISELEQWAEPCTGTKSLISDIVGTHSPRILKSVWLRGTGTESPRVLQGMETVT